MKLTSRTALPNKRGVARSLGVRHSRTTPPGRPRGAPLLVCIFLLGPISGSSQVTGPVCFHRFLSQRHVPSKTTDVIVSFLGATLLSYAFRATDRLSFRGDILLLSVHPFQSIPV